MPRKTAKNASTAVSSPKPKAPPRSTATLKASGVTATHSLREDMGRVLNAHFETARHHQDIRDRWHRFYTLVVGAIFSVTGALITTLITTEAVSLLLPSGMQRDDVYLRVIPVIIDIAASLVFVFGVLSLGLYLTQVVNYFIDYYYIDRILESFSVLHGHSIEKLKMPDPFIFTYSYVDDILKCSLAEFVCQRYWRSLASWSADFWANSFTMFINSVCATLVSVGIFWPTDRWAIKCHTIFVFVLFFGIQVIVRQVLLGVALYSAIHQVGSSQAMDQLPDASKR